MTKAGDRILAGAREALAYSRGEDVPGLIVHPGTRGGHNQTAEAAGIEQQHREVNDSMDTASEAVQPGPSTRQMTGGDL